MSDILTGRIYQAEEIRDAIIAIADHSFELGRNFEKGEKVSVASIYDDINDVMKIVGWGSIEDLERPKNKAIGEPK